MLLRFFRINDPYRLLGLLILLSFFSLPYFIFPALNTSQELWNFVLGEAIHAGKLMYVEVIDSTAPLSAAIFGLTDLLFGRSLTAQHILALTLIVFQASYFAILLINNKAYNESTYIPALVFGLLCFFSFDLFSFSPELLGSTVLLLALNNLFKEIEFRIERDEIVLNLGVYLGIATLLIFSYAVFLIAVMVILIFFTRLTFRKLLLLLFGFALPHGLLISLYYLWGETASLFYHFYLPSLVLHTEMLINARGLLLLGALPVVYFIFSLFMLNREAHFTKYQSQLFQVMFQWILACLIQVFLARELTPHSLVIFIPPVAYFISHYLQLIHRKSIAEMMLWVLLVGLLAINFLARTDKIRSIRYGGLFPPVSVYGGSMSGKRIMVLTTDPGTYQRNKMAGFFLDWELSREIFEQPDYYDHVLIVDKALRSDPPDTIIDPENLMSRFLERIPEWKAKYRREGVFYYRVNLPAIERH